LFVRIAADGTLGVCGLPGDPSPAGVDARDGVVRGMRRILQNRNECGFCWSAARVELLLALRLRPSAIAGLLARATGRT